MNKRASCLNYPPISSILHASDCRIYAKFEKRIGRRENELKELKSNHDGQIANLDGSPCIEGAGCNTRNLFRCLADLGSDSCCWGQMESEGTKERGVVKKKSEERHGQNNLQLTKRQKLGGIRMGPVTQLMR